VSSVALVAPDMPGFPTAIRMSGAMRAAIMSFAMSPPSRTPMSKRSATMSVKRLSLLISMLMSGYLVSQGSNLGQIRVRAACSVAVIRTEPAGLPRSSPKTANSASMSAKRGPTA